MDEREIRGRHTDAPRAIYRLGSPAVVLVVLPVLLQLRRRLADETRLIEIPLDRAPDLPAIKHRRAPVVQQWRVLAHYVQQMQTFVLAELVPPPTIVLFLLLFLRQTARPHSCEISRDPALPSLNFRTNFCARRALPRSPEDSRAAQSSTLISAFVSTCKTCYLRWADFSSRCASLPLRMNGAVWNTLDPRRRWKKEERADGVLSMVICSLLSCAIPSRDSYFYVELKWNK